MTKGWNALAIYALPPLLGAVIGFVTNAIAIKMLFRPLRKVRILGIPLPFTPGIIPRRRHELAESISRMVSRELLTEEALRKRLEQPSFLEGLQKQVALLTNRILRSPFDSPRFPGLEDFLRTAETGFREGLGSYLDSPQFRALVLRILRVCTEGFLEKTPEEILNGILKGEEDAPGTAAGDTAEDQLRSFLDEPSRRIFAGFGEALSARVREGASPKTLMGGPLPERLEEILDAFYPGVVEYLLQTIRIRRVRREAPNRGRYILRGVQGVLVHILRRIAGEEHPRRPLIEGMPLIMDGLLDSAEEVLKSEDFRREAVASAAREIRSLWEKPLRDTAENMGRDPEEAAQALGALVVRLPESLRLPERLAAGLMGFFRRRWDQPLGEILQANLGLPPEELAEKSAGLITRLIRREAEDRLAVAPSSIADSFLHSLQGRSLEKILLLSPEKKERLDHLLTRGVFRILVKRLPGILQAFEVESLVRDRIDELDAAEVERLLLEVISRHLAYINLFGAILGFLIGGVQVVLMVLR